MPNKLQPFSLNLTIDSHQELLERPLNSKQDSYSLTYHHLVMVANVCSY